MSRSVREIISGIVPAPSDDRARDIIQELWGEGWTFTRRAQDPYEVAGLKVPPGMSYQWVPTDDLELRSAGGWRPVQTIRHDGLFAPIGYEGNIEIRGLTLVEAQKSDVDAAHAERISGAQKNIDDWAKKYGGTGISGTVTTVDHVHGTQTKTVGDPDSGATRLPTDMLEHISKVFVERDRLMLAAQDDCLARNPNATGVSFSQETMAKITAQSIENVRAEISKAVRDRTELAKHNEIANEAT